MRAGLWLEMVQGLVGLASLGCASLISAFAPAPRAIAPDLAKSLSVQPTFSNPLFAEEESLKVVCSALMMEKCTRSTGMISAVRGGEEVQIMGEVAVATVAVVTVAWTSRLVDRQALRPAGRLRSVSTVVTVAMRRPANDRLVIAADLVDVGCVAVLISSADARRAPKQF